MVSIHVQRQLRLSASPMSGACSTPCALSVPARGNSVSSRAPSTWSIGTWYALAATPALVAAGSPGDWRALRKLRADLRRHGLVLTH
jgi:hypothetical protein